jgi:hypothetical protein
MDVTQCRSLKTIILSAINAYAFSYLLYWQFYHFYSVLSFPIGSEKDPIVQYAMLRTPDLPTQLRHKGWWCYIECHFARVMCHLACVTCHVSLVMCHLSCVTCHVSLVMCHLSCVTCHDSCMTWGIHVQWAGHIGFHLITRISRVMHEPRNEHARSFWHMTRDTWHMTREKWHSM